jgi:predicted RNA binding protein YcfA (HicA-like mRNA interferase family)
MRTPRNISGKELASRLSSLGYQPIRQRGSHLRLQTTEKGEHSVTIPLHDPIPIGTLKSILREVANHLGITTEELLITLGY